MMKWGGKQAMPGLERSWGGLKSFLGGIQGRMEKADAPTPLFFTAAAEDCGGPLSNLQAASGRSRSLSSLPADCLLHSVRGSRVNHRVFDNAPLDDRSVLR